MNKQSPQDAAQSESGSDIIKLIFYWSLAVIPLLWGITMTVLKALVLFK